VAVEPTATSSVVEEPSSSSGVTLPEVDPGILSGNITMAGSSTVYPLAEAMAERFKEEGFTEDKGTITIDNIGSGAGFERFCKAGETDISNASRKIKDSEVQNCAAINRTPIEFRIGTDALAVVVSKTFSYQRSRMEELPNLPKMP
jgi:ABC-type phosphate transport system substrate-binding protein